MRRHAPWAVEPAAFAQYGLCGSVSLAAHVSAHIELNDGIAESSGPSGARWQARRLQHYA